jgi:glycosyltransferase involved in cell wall biosynthesis
MKSIRVIHVPYTSRNPYQRLLFDELKKLGLEIKGAKIARLPYLALFDTTIVTLLINFWKPDIIHIHWPHSFLIEKRGRLRTILKSSIFFIELIVARVVGIKVVWTVHNLKKHENNYMDLEKYLLRILARLTNVIIAHCKTAKNDIHKILKVKKNDKVVIIPHGNYIGCYSNNFDRKSASSKLKLPDSEMRFLFLGEIRYYKGVLELIEAFGALGSKEVQLIISGKPKTTKIHEEIEIKIGNCKNIYTNLRFIDSNEIEMYINSSDFMVFPYRDIFTSGGIHLAMSFGKPIIAPRLGCIKETLDNIGSILYDPMDKEGLKNALTKAYFSKEKLELMGIHNFELANENNWKDIAAMTYNQYLKCIGN